MYNFNFNSFLIKRLIIFFKIYYKWISVEAYLETYCNYQVIAAAITGFRVSNSFEMHCFSYLENKIIDKCICYLAVSRLVYFFLWDAEFRLLVRSSFTKK